ncbi:glycosyltransferase [Billgrantia pellis]|uniref:Glycosyltransferase n=1 Tax=Billgrantia pellis TaxID=2606936 RepID=A0A7V7G3J1_9GAMM|nr:glycosyltransferase [Halomonas pellis]KAA0014611.1 glycosyltransferase [Halomonas pellis]
MQLEYKLIPFTVLLSIYEKEKKINFNSAMESIWDYQSLKPNQIVLVKDGPLPADLELLIEEWEKKIGKDTFDLVSLSENVGLGAALNQGINICRNELIARMDTDDISLPHRFERQIAFMHEHPCVDVLSGAIEEWDENFEEKIFTKRLPIKHEEIVKYSSLRSPINHPAVVFKKSAVIKAGGYPEIYPEDYALWIEMLHKGCIFSNIPEVILRMRTGVSFYARRGRKFLSGELYVLRLQLEYGMISKLKYVSLATSRSMLRLSPSLVRRLLYKTFRKV